MALPVLMLLGVLGADPSAAATSTPQAPPRWWQNPDGPFRSALQSVRLRVVLDETRERQAEELLQHFVKCVTDHVAANRVEIDALAADYMAYRRRVAGRSKSSSLPEDLRERTQRLYKPVADWLQDYRGRLDRIENGAKPFEAVTTPPPVSPSAPTPGPPPTATNDPGWATAAEVEAFLTELPPRPDEAAVRKVFESQSHNFNADQAALDRTLAKLAECRTAQASEWQRLDEVSAILRRFPTSVRRADLVLVGRHWRDSIQAAEQLIADLRSELARTPPSPK